MYAKTVLPYSWGAEVDKPMFVGRQWYQHPLYGTMYIDREELRFYGTICSKLSADGAQHDPTTTLLSMPFPFANYFCGIPPWNNYVQTWYDTVTPTTVHTLIGQLQTSPPKWILYQRDTGMIRAHEVEYNHGQPIAHRDLDNLLMQKVASGEWMLVEKADYLNGDGWYLVQTHP